jgi:AcrR family transcriptional regulator
MEVEQPYRRSANRAASDGEMPALAVQLIEAARRILVEQGVQALSLENVAREAGQYKASVRYYFGSKSGLVAALVDSMTPGTVFDSTVRSATSLPPGPERVRRQIGGWKALAKDSDEMCAFFEVLPAVLRDDDLRAKVADLYRHYRRTDVQLFDAPEGFEREVEGLATLVSAAVDGVGEQALLDPDAVDIEASFETLTVMVDLYLEHLRDAAAAKKGA